jgi:ribosomal protein S18 acetylase RimI-like enzyme
VPNGRLRMRGDPIQTREEKAVEKQHTGGRAWLDWLEIGALDASETEEVLDVTARGMRDNPLPVAAFGDDPEKRRREFRSLIAADFAARDYSHTLVARREDGVIVGVCGMMPPGGCQPTIGQQLRLLPAMFRLGPRIVARMMRWLGAWQKHDPEERHWHLGPLAVDAHLQGEGVGSRIMGVFCAQMDAAHEDAYLETDKEINVRFYEKFGFEVISEQVVLGVPSWFMLRRAERRDG